MDNLQSVFDIVLDIGMVFGPLIAYAGQLIEIQEKKDSKGFAKGVSFILIIANISRIFFW